MTYDFARRRVVMVGTANGVLETWEWAGVDWVRNRTKTTPPARLGHELAYDSFRERTVLYGGEAGITRFTDTWEYDGTDWIQRKRPPTREAW